MIADADVVTRLTTRPCAQIDFALGQNDTLTYYPGCEAFYSGSNPNARVIVTANFMGDNPMETSASLAIPFGTAGWIALVLHTIAIELYVRFASVIAIDEFVLIVIIAPLDAY